MGERLYPHDVTSKQAKRKHVIDLAYSLAETGDFAGWLDLEHYLIHNRGFSTARQLLDDGSMRDELEKICARNILRRKADAKATGKPYQEPMTPIEYFDPTTTKRGAIRNRYVAEAEKAAKEAADEQSEDK